MASVLAAPHCLGHRLWTCYNTQLQRRPLLVNCATSATLWAAGDLLAERIQRTSQRHGKPAHSSSSGRRHRTAYTSVFGGLVFGPLGHVWYAWLDTVAASFGVPGSLRYILGKVLVDTSMWTPVYVGLFIAYSSLLINRDGVGGTMEKLRQDFAPTMIAEAAIWPPVMALLFARVPASHQLLAVNAVTVADVALISWLEEHSPAELLAQVTGSPSEEPGSEEAGPTGRWARSPSPSP